jgi:L-2-hydroxyglutarate oxidase LhgO
MDIKFTIIGAGVIGLAVALKLSERCRDDEICVIEQNDRITGENQSSRNSGVIHAGIYYDRKEQPLKARLSVSGNRELYNFCQTNDIPHKKTGKLVVATDELELEYLDETARIASENGVSFAYISTAEEIARYEPNVCGIAALYFPDSGIIDSTSLVKRLGDLAEKNGVYILCGTKLLSLKNENGVIGVETKSGGEIERFESEYLINCGGLFSDEIARMVDNNFSYEIEGVRGESAKFNKESGDKIWMRGLNVYPAPYGYYNHNGKRARITLGEMKKMVDEGKVTKTTGVHLTPTFDLSDGEFVIGNIVTIGPQKNVGFGKYNYGDNLHHSGTYLEYVNNFFPYLAVEDIELHQTGIMAVVKGKSDWIIERSPKYGKMINLVGIDSPGLTASLSIADYVIENFLD